MSRDIILNFLNCPKHYGLLLNFILIYAVHAQTQLLMYFGTGKLNVNIKQQTCRELNFCFHLSNSSRNELLMFKQQLYSLMHTVSKDLL